MGLGSELVPVVVYRFYEEVLKGLIVIGKDALSDGAIVGAVLSHALYKLADFPCTVAVLSVDEQLMGHVDPLSQAVHAGAGPGEGLNTGASSVFKGWQAMPELMP